MRMPLSTYLRFTLGLTLLSFAITSADGQDAPGPAEKEAGTVPADALDIKVVGAAEEKAEPVEPEALTIGSKAPALNIEHWVQDGNGKYPWVKEFESGKVYVVEFWATWCPPCIAAMPHIAELQTKHSETVQVVSITREDLETVEKFLDRKLGKSRTSKDAEEEPSDESEDEPMTYRDLTSVYCLTADPDESSTNDYMLAAGQNGIPCAFLVGKTGLIEWIGHPLSIDEPLEAVLGDRWDREAFKSVFEAEQKAVLLQAKIVRLMRSGETDAALKVLDGAIADKSFSAVNADLKQMKLQILVSSEDHEEQAVAYMLQRLDDPNHDATSANDLAWLIFRLADVGRFEDDAVTARAVELAQSKIETAGATKPYIMDTVARLLSLQGKTDEAIELQTKAVELADEKNRPDMEAFLKQLQSGKDE
ncbi:redoxin domain-containing protein [Stieleria varia]|uniref:Thiol:disulfide interchange protein TlpA n=1 Tax=Stieleria varia TaxID=2528005 RepID=A0A5C6B2B0_9BACT|nr:redoxin domain-containing protein [Stieleria varia]TWU05977.1 Thiol:disulfide interchange protein TlpA [Stieleria varia]